MTYEITQIDLYAMAMQPKSHDYIITKKQLVIHVKTINYFEIVKYFKLFEYLKTS